MLAISMGLTGTSLVGSVSAQEAIPTTTVCDVEPRSADFLVNLIAQPALEATAQPLIGVPSGSDDVDPETREAVIAVLEELVACVNAGELLRAYALYDDAFLRRVIDPEGLMPDSIAAELGQSFATPVAVEAENTTTLDKILLVRVLPDGSVAIMFRSHVGADAEQAQTHLYVLREIDARWLIIDGLTNLDPAQLPAG